VQEEKSDKGHGNRTASAANNKAETLDSKGASKGEVGWGSRPLTAQSIHSMMSGENGGKDAGKGGAAQERVTLPELKIERYIFVVNSR
jgi:hypothetical protein